MTFDYKKEYKEFYMPKGTPSIVRVPKMNYIAVRGSGNPNDADGEYKQSIGLLYGIAFTIRYAYTVHTDLHHTKRTQLWRNPVSFSP